MADNLFGIVNLTKLSLYVSYAVFFYILTEVITISKFNRRKRSEALTNKQIIEENSQTKTYYFRVVLITNCFYYTLALVILQEWCSSVNVVMLLLSKIIYIASLLLMIKISAPKFSEASELINPGVDLNADCPSSVKEAASVFPMVYLTKDLIILSAAVQILSLFSNYFWFLWLLVLVRLSIPCICWLLKELLLHDINWKDKGELYKY